MLEYENVHLFDYWKFVAEIKIFFLATNRTLPYSQNVLVDPADMREFFNLPETNSYNFTYHCIKNMFYIDFDFNRKDMELINFITRLTGAEEGEYFFVRI